MRASLVALVEAAAEAAKPAKEALYKAGGNASNQKRQFQNNRSQYVLVEVPRTALATDVQRALKEVQAVPAHFPLSAITARPIGSKRTPSLLTSYHLAFNSIDEASRAQSLLSQRPLFAASSTRASPTRFSEFPGVRPEEHLTPRATFVESPAKEWVERSLARAARESQRPPEVGGREPVKDHVGAEWVMDRRSKNRRVLITGLPLHATEQDVRKLASGVADVAGIACRRLPHGAWSNTSAWAVTAASVAHAYQMARKVNRNFYAEPRFGHKFPMRAHVHQ